MGGGGTRSWFEMEGGVKVWTRKWGGPSCGRRTPDLGYHPSPRYVFGTFPNANYLIHVHFQRLRPHIHRALSMNLDRLTCELRRSCAWRKKPDQVTRNPRSTFSDTCLSWSSLNLTCIYRHVIDAIQELLGMSACAFFTFPVLAEHFWKF